MKNYTKNSLLKPRFKTNNIGAFILLVVCSIYTSISYGQCTSYYIPSDEDYTNQYVNNGVVYIQNTKAQCTGFLINNTDNTGDAYVLTVAHNIDILDDGVFNNSYDLSVLNSLPFYFNRVTDANGQVSMYGPIIGATIAARPSSFVGDVNDWILLKLNGNPTQYPNCYNVTFLGWDVSGTYGHSILLMGYPGTHPLCYAFAEPPFVVDNVLKAQFLSGFYAAAGESGSPIFDWDSKVSIGIHAQSAYQTNGTPVCWGTVLEYPDQQLKFEPLLWVGVRISEIFNNNIDFRAKLDPHNKLQNGVTICPNLHVGNVTLPWSVNPIFELSAKTFYASNVYIPAGSIIGGSNVQLSGTTIRAGTPASTKILTIAPITGNCGGSQQRFTENNSNVNKVFQNESQISQLQVLPNPIVNSAQVTFTTEKVEKIKLSIWNMLGEQVKVITDETLGKGNHSIDFETTDIHAGMYLLVKESSSGKATQKILITR